MTAVVLVIINNNNRINTSLLLLLMIKAIIIIIIITEISQIHKNQKYYSQCNNGTITKKLNFSQNGKHAHF